MLGREEAEELFEEKLYNDDERGEKKNHWLPKLVIVLVLIAFIAGIVFATVPQARGMLTGEDYVTSTQLKKAVNIENLSSAEFVYNGIAEKHKDNSDEIEYRVAYEATVKVGSKNERYRFRHRPIEQGYCSPLARDCREQCSG